ncbi:MAG: hypothetical protein EOO90_25765, partial [Pedobacter sp.]
MIKNLLSSCGFTRNSSRFNTNLTNKFVNCFSRLLLFSLLFLAAGLQDAFADGSKDLYPTNNSTTTPGRRAVLVSSTGAISTASYPFQTRGTIKVYAKIGETIYLGSSAQNMGGGRIRMFRPGTVPNANRDNFDYSTIADATGQINNRNQELAGSLPATGGYTPYTRTVSSTDGEGIWEIDFVSPDENNAAVSVPQYTATRNWTNGDQPTGQPWILAWDVSVRNALVTNTNLTSFPFIKGRVYTNVFNGLVSNDYTATGGFYGKFYTYTKDGYAYLVSPNGQVGVGFTFFANNRGFTTGANGAGNATYKSLNSSTNPNVKNPTQADDVNITHKLFYAPPASDMPTTALNRNVSTWLRPAVVLPEASGLTFKGVEGSSSSVSSKGANITFNSNVNGKYKITIPGNGAFIDRTLVGIATAGQMTVFWDGRAGLSNATPSLPGNKVPPGTTVNSIKIQLFGAEVHFPFIDTEINPNGVIIEQLNSSFTPISGSDVVYWNDTDITFTGTATASTPPEGYPITSSGVSSNVNGHKWGSNSTTDGDNDFGNNKALDTYSFVPGAESTESVNVVISQADLQVVSITPSSTSAKVGSTLTYTIVARNINRTTESSAGAGDQSVSAVSGAKLFFDFPSGFTITNIGAPTTNAGTVTQTASSSTATQFQATLNMTSGSQVTYVITGTVGASLSNTSLATRAAILRSADVSDPDATDGSTNAFSNNVDTECNGAPSGLGCNNILNSSVAVPASVSITTATPNISETTTGGSFTVNLTSAVSGNTVVNYSIANVANSATNGVDYNTVTPLSGSVTILAGNTSASIPITVFDDAILEPTESITLTITGVTNTLTPSVTTAFNSADLTSTINIADNDAASVSIGNVTVAETLNGSNAIFNVTLTGAVQNSFTVSYTTSGVTAVAGSDFTVPATQTVIFPAGSISGAVQTITIPILDDLISEPTETFTLTLNAATQGVTIGTAVGTGTITDNDASSIAISDVTVAETL